MFPILGWIRGGKDKPWWKIIDYCSLRFSIVTFLLCIILSFLSLYLLQTDDVIAFVEEFWQPILLTSIALSYSNFTASAIEIWNKAKAGQKQIFQKKTN